MRTDALDMLQHLCNKGSKTSNKTELFTSENETMELGEFMALGLESPVPQTLTEQKVGLSCVLP